MYKKRIPKTSIYRLGIYLRGLEKLASGGKTYISSQEMGKIFGVDSAQLRKDLSFFGQFGQVGKGYHIKNLLTNLKKILRLYRKKWRVALVGVGNLGSALISYRGFKEAGFFIEVAFDNDPKKMGKVYSGIKIYSSEELEEIVKKRNIKIGIITVPGESAQDIAERMVKAGIKSLLNFAPVRLNLPSEVIVRNVDLSTELMSLPFHIS